MDDDPGLSGPPFHSDDYPDDWEDDDDDFYDDDEVFYEDDDWDDGSPETLDECVGEMSAGIRADWAEFGGRQLTDEEKGVLYGLLKGFFADKWEGE
jgi:hypothetical protein